MKQSENLILWSEERKIFGTPNVRENVTGKGKDTNGNLLFWIRRGGPGNSDTIHELYKTDGEVFVKVANPIFPTVCGHIGDIVTLSNGTMIAFFNTYGNARAWGVVKSIDDGATWSQQIIGSGLTRDKCPVEISGVEISDGKILAIGRQDQWSIDMSQHQIQSSDYGETWTIQSTNITDINSSTASLLFDKTSNIITMFYYRRGHGTLRMIRNLASEVWDNPMNWGISEEIAKGSYSTLDAGNVNAIEFNGKQVVTFYSGNETDCGIYAVVV